MLDTSEFIKIALVLTWIHYVADFPLQGEFLANFKGKYDYLLFSHAVIWSGSMSLGLAYFGIFTYWKLAMLLIGHFLIDRWKSRKKDKTNALTNDLWKDQYLHFIQIFICLF